MLRVSSAIVVLTLVAVSHAGASEPVAPPFDDWYATTECSNPRLGSCTQSADVDPTGVFDLMAETVSPVDGVLPGEIYSSAFAYLSTSHQLTEPADRLEVEITIAIDNAIARADGALLVEPSYLTLWARVGDCDCSGEAFRRIVGYLGPQSLDDVRITVRFFVQAHEGPLAPGSIDLMFSLVASARRGYEAGRASVEGHGAITEVVVTEHRR